MPYCRNEEWMQSMFLIIKTAYIKTLADRRHLKVCMPVLPI
jgi:hypothetical protein